MLLGAPTAYWAIVAGIVGLAFGSFATVVASRWPAGGSLVSPRSHCTSCARTLSPLEMVPVLSWAALRGRCRTCGASVSWRYPAIELASGLLAAGAIVGFGPPGAGLSAAVLGGGRVPGLIRAGRARPVPTR